MSAEAYRAAAPELLPECSEAVAVWNFCGGWQPAVLLLAIEWFQIADVDRLIHLMLALRDRTGA